MHRIILALGLVVLGCGEVTLSNIDAMTCPVDPEPVQCEQCERLCPETGWGVAYADVFVVLGSASQWSQDGGFAAIVNTGTSTLQVNTPKLMNTTRYASLNLQVQAGAQPVAALVEPGTAYGALNATVEYFLTRTGILSGPPEESSSPLLTLNFTKDADSELGATLLADLEVEGLPGRVVLPLTVHSVPRPFGPPTVTSWVISVRFMCAQAVE